MRKLICFFFLCQLAGWSQTPSRIIIPPFDDKYCAYVKQLEAGQPDIDYQDFRFSFIESEQFKIANKRSHTLDSLQNRMYELMNKKEFDKILDVTRQMLSIDYTSIMAHKILRQTLMIMGDTAKSRHYHDIQFGLLRSITSKGDGRTCETAWPVMQIAEEYFILNIVLDAELLKQSVYNTGGMCDKMEVKEGRQKKTYYFEISKVFQGYKKLGRD